jgi:predicted metal-binding protein
VLTPLIARQLAVACPGTARFAEALAMGSDAVQAAAGAQLFENCAGNGRRERAEARRIIASAAAGAAHLALGVLRNDAAELQRSIDATAELRADVPLSDDQIRRWSAIPDAIDMERRKLLVANGCAVGDPAVTAAYVNVAARQGTAWISAARPLLTGCPPLAATAYDPPDKAHPMTLLPRGTVPGRPDPAIVKENAPHR